MESIFDVAVVGGGLAGLLAATTVARTGARVVLFEGSASVGGRARSQQEAGFTLNLGAHALYRAGALERSLDALRIPFRGAVVTPRGFYALRGDDAHVLPTGLGALLRTGLLSFRGRREFARLMLRLPRVDASTLESTTVTAWLDAEVSDETTRQVALAFVRLATYGGAPERTSAACAVRQMQLATRGVTYLDGGWQTLVDGLRSAARTAGVVFHERAHVTCVEGDAGRRRVRLADGRASVADAVVVATGPDDAASILEPGGTGALHARIGALEPVRAACLDVALSRPLRDARLLLGIDRPIYVSNHSAYAKLAPAGSAVVHALAYDVGSAAAPARETLEAMVDRLQPGYRDVVVHARYLPRITVHHALVRADDGGYAGRPPVALGAGVFLAGDWVGDEGLLADASAASAMRAAKLAVAHLAGRPRRVHAA